MLIDSLSAGLLLSVPDTLASRVEVALRLYLDKCFERTQYSENHRGDRYQHPN